MKYIIVGNGDYAKMMGRYLGETKDIQISGFTVESKYISEEMDNTPVIPAEEIYESYPPSEYYLIMGIGYRNMNHIKKQEYNRYKKMGYHFENYIHPTAIIGKSVIMGEGNNIFEGVVIQEGVKMGDGNLVYGGVLIAHENSIGSFNSFSVKACIAGCSMIGNNCFFGANSTVRDHVSISDYTLVGAGAYVDVSTNPYGVVVSQKSVVLEGRSSLEFI